MCKRVAQDKMMEEFYYSSNIEPYEHWDGWLIICERPPWWKGLPYWHMPLLDHQPPAYQETSLADFLTSTQSRLSGFCPSFLRGHPRDCPDDLPDIPEIEYLIMNIGMWIPPMAMHQKINDNTHFQSHIRCSKN